MREEEFRKAGTMSSGGKEWVEVQKKTFTNWTNDKLKDTDRRVEELETDFVDGVTLIKLLQVLSHGKKIGRYVVCIILYTPPTEASSSSRGLWHCPKPALTVFDCSL